jgi:WD40 repeat protein
VVYDPIREQLISCGTEPALRIWDARTGASLGTLDGHVGTVEDLELHPDGRRLISVDQDGKVHLWDVQDQSLLTTFNPRSGTMRSVAISRSGALVATCSDVVHVFDLEDGNVLATIPLLDPPQRVCFPFRDDRMCVADESGMLHMFLPVHDATGVITDYQPGPSWRAHKGRPFVLAASGNGSFMSAGGDGRVTVWNSSALSSTEVKTVSGPRPVSFAFDCTRGRLLIGGVSGLCVWDYEAPKQTSVDLDTSSHWRRVAVSRDTQLYAAGDNDGNVEIWDASSLSRRLRVSIAPGRSVCALDFACDGQAVLVATAETGSQSDTVVVLDTETGNVKQRFDVGHASVAAFSPTEPDILVLSALPHTIRLFHWPTAKMLWESAEMRERPVSESLAFTPDGQRIVTGSGDRIVRVWDRQTGALIHELRGHRADIGHIGVSPDGRTIASIDDDGMLKLWHNATGQLLFEIVSHREQDPELFEFSPDGRWLAIAVAVNTVELFPLRQ